jgi:hypothetical protein
VVQVNVFLALKDPSDIAKYTNAGNIRSFIKTKSEAHPKIKINETDLFSIQAAAGRLPPS